MTQKISEADMTISQNELEQIARLAYLETDAEQASTLSAEINSIMNFVDNLRSVDTNNVAPLYHPFDLHQRLREDKVSENECLAQLEEIAPLFEEGLYLVPKVIDVDK